MSEAIAFVSRDLALSTVALVRLLDAAEICIGILPCVVHSYARTKRHL
jgi:hypothetical protein